MPNRISRRTFTKAGAAAAIGLGALSKASHGRTLGANDRIAWA